GTCTPRTAASPTPTPTPTATPGTLAATPKTFSRKTVVVTFQNDTAVGQKLTELHMTWPQATNGNLSSVKMGATTIYSTSTASPLNTSSLLGTDAQRTIAAGSCQTLTFTFVHNVANAPYTGTAHFLPFGDVTYLP